MTLQVIKTYITTLHGQEVEVKVYSSADSSSKEYIFEEEIRNAEPEQKNKVKDLVEIFRNIQDYEIEDEDGEQED